MVIDKVAKTVFFRTQDRPAYTWVFNFHTFGRTGVRPLRSKQVSTHSLKEKETKGQRDKGLKGQRDKGTKRQRDKGQRDKGIKG